MKEENGLYNCKQCEKEIILNNNIVFEFEGPKFAFCSRKCWKEWVNKNIIKSKDVS